MRTVRTVEDLADTLRALSGDRALHRTLLSIETHGSTWDGTEEWGFYLQDTLLDETAAKALTAAVGTRIRPAIAVIGACEAGTDEGRLCVEQLLADGVLSISTAKDAKATHLRGRVLPALSEAIERGLSIGDPVVPARESLNALLAAPRSDWVEWVAWRARVVGLGSQHRAA